MERQIHDGSVDAVEGLAGSRSSPGSPRLLKDLPPICQPRLYIEFFDGEQKHLFECNVPGYEVLPRREEHGILQGGILNMKMWPRHALTKTGMPVVCENVRLLIS
ncbi:MAG: hypothetical protein ACR2JY_21720 [Chloroflexota bacterium]